MNVPFHPNSGDHPSRLQLARYHTGEADPAERAAVEAWIAVNGRGGLDELARAEAPPFDAADLHARARRLAAAGPAPAPANRPMWPLLLALAAALGLAAIPLLSGPANTPTAPEIRFRGGGLEVHQLEAGQLVPYSRAALGEGDVLGFRLPPGPEARLVLLSVDGNGSVNVYFPATGTAPLAVPAGTAPRPLPGSLTLDDAPGPEIFVAVFESDTPAAISAAQAAWAKGGPGGVLAWAEAEATVDAVRVERR